MDSFMPAIAVVLLIVCVIFKWQYSYWNRRKIEGLPPLPIFGNLFECFFMQKHCTDIFDEIYNCSPKAKYIGFYKFHAPGLLLKDLQLIKEVLSGDLCEHYQDDGCINENIHLMCREKLFVSKLNISEMMRTTIKAYFDESRFKDHFARLKNLSTTLIEYIEGAPEWPTEEGFEAKKLSSKFFIEASLSCSLNIEPHCFTKSTSDFLEIYEKYFLGTPFGGLFSLLSTRLDRRIEETLQSNASLSDGPEDTFSAIFGAHNKHNLVQCLIGLYDVFESSNTLFAYGLYELALNGDMQEQIRNHIKQIELTSDKELGVEDITKGLPFLNNILLETLRLHSHIFALKKKCIKRHKLPKQHTDSEVAYIEKGCNVLISAYSIHLDPVYFSDPFTFKPNRYLDNPDGLRPYPCFGKNSEYCLGFKYGFMVAKLAIALILKEYQVVLTSKNTGVLTFSKKTPYLSSEEGIWLSFSKLSK